MSALCLFFKLSKLNDSFFKRTNLIGRVGVEAWSKLFYLSNYDEENGAKTP